MKTRQPSPACAGTAFNIVISLADPIRCGLSAALAAEIGWTRRPDALAAAKDRVALLGPAPAAGQPPEPEQAALNRAELNYLFGLLSAAAAAAPSGRLGAQNR